MLDNSYSMENKEFKLSIEVNVRLLVVFLHVLFQVRVNTLANNVCKHFVVYVSTVHTNTAIVWYGMHYYTFHWYKYVIFLIKH